MKSKSENWFAWWKYHKLVNLSPVFLFVSGHLSLHSGEHTDLFPLPSDSAWINWSLNMLTLCNPAAVRTSPGSLWWTEHVHCFIGWECSCLERKHKMLCIFCLVGLLPFRKHPWDNKIFYLWYVKCVFVENDSTSPPWSYRPCPEVWRLSPGRRDCCAGMHPSRQLPEPAHTCKLKGFLLAMPNSARQDSSELSAPLPSWWRSVWTVFLSWNIGALSKISL